MQKATESPLRFASVCFPPCFPGFRARGGEAEEDPKDSSQPLIYLKKIGVGEGIRTLDPDLGKVWSVTLATMQSSIGNDNYRSQWCGWSESNRHFREETRFCIPLWLSPRHLCLAASAL